MITTIKLLNTLAIQNTDFFNQEVLDTLIGTMLGDGSITINKSITLSTYSFAQATVRTEYATIVINGLGILTMNRVIKAGSTFDHRYNKTNTSVHFTTLGWSELVWIHQIFYTYDNEKNKWVKVIPLNIADFLTPRALAYWIIDDGYQDLRNGVTLCTDCFTREEVLILIAAIEKNFGYRCTLRWKKKKYYRIYISRKDLPAMQNTLEKYFHPSMLYKLYGKNYNP